VAKTEVDGKAIMLDLYQLVADRMSQLLMESTLNTKGETNEDN